MAILLALRDTPLLGTGHYLIEMRSVLVLLAMSFLLLPILPNRPIDPWQVLNPAEIWLWPSSSQGFRRISSGSAIRWVPRARSCGRRWRTCIIDRCDPSFSSLARPTCQQVVASPRAQALAGATMLGRVLILVAVLSPALVGKVVMPVVRTWRVAIAPLLPGAQLQAANR